MTTQLADPNGALPVRLVAPPSDLPVGSPEWQATRLSAELDNRGGLVDLYEDYTSGRHKLSFASSRFREAFGQMLAAVSDNWIPLVLDASIERLRPQGFRFGGAQDGDQEAWRIWQDNHLDADGPLGFREAAKHGESYFLVWPDTSPKPAGIFGRLFARRSSDVVPRITVEHPSQMVVARVAGDRRRRAAALKRWCEDDGTIMATLYLPNDIYRFQARDGKWEPRKGVEFRETNRLGVVPVIPVVNDPQMIPCRAPASLSLPPHRIGSHSHVGLGRSDMADVITTIDQINKLLCDMMVASEIAAFRQRWATGLDVPRDETTNEPVEPFKAAVDRLWIAEGESGKEVKFGEFGATDLSNYTNAIENRIQSLAARTRTPPHYLLGSIVNASGDALKAAETGLASKVRGKQAAYGEAIEDAMRLAFAWKGDERATDMSAEIVWAPAESRSESEYVDSLVKKMSFGVPKEQLWSDAGYSPQQIARFKSMLLEESLRTDIFGVTAPEPPTDPSVEPNEPTV